MRYNANGPTEMTDIQNTSFDNTSKNFNVNTQQPNSHLNTKYYQQRELDKG